MPFGTSRTVIYDADGTLWPCGPYYQAAEAETIGVLREAWPDCPYSNAELSDLRHRVEWAFLRRHGYFDEIFPASWAETYLQLCSRHGRVPSRVTIDQMRRAAMSVFDQRYPLFPGVEDSLVGLRAAGHRLHLLSLGSTKHQMKKIQHNGLTELFHSINIVRRGKHKVMQRLAEPGRRTIMVGDSLPSDMIPAIHLGLTPVWIHTTDPWFLGHQPINREALHIIRKVTELPALLERLR